MTFTQAALVLSSIINRALLHVDPVPCEDVQVHCYSIHSWSFQGATAAFPAQVWSNPALDCA
jgi:hypothetical protein